MTPVLCQIKHDPENGTHGDCMRACVATVLDMDPASVPHFYHDGSAEAGMQRITEFLAKLKLAPFFMHYPATLTLDEVLDWMGEQNPTVPCILFGEAESGGDHVVVCLGGKVVHNPSWLAEIVSAPTHGHWTIMVIART